MNGFEAILLGIVQGLTEFLPISSSGHLILVPWLLDIRYLEQNPDFNRAFDVVIHFGTLIAVVAYFRSDLGNMLSGAINVLRTRRAVTEAERLAVAVVIATIPAVIIGAFGESFIAGRLGEPWQIAILLAAFGLLLAWADRRPERDGLDSMSPRRALIVGSAQALALAPGVSRSGVTITAGRFLGLSRDAAARFSFLLLVPVTGGAVVKKAYDVGQVGLEAGQPLALTLGTVAAAISGYAAIGGLLAFVRTRSYDAFVVYRLIAASAIVALIAAGVRDSTF
jgi:undecaprenyl-diphosphatase